MKPKLDCPFFVFVFVVVVVVVVVNPHLQDWVWWYPASDCHQTMMIGVFNANAGKENVFSGLV